MDFTYIDSMARLGYQFAAGTGRVPHLSDQLGIDAFNAGISNHNVHHGTSVPPIKEGMKSVHIQGSNNGQADKVVAIVGA